MSAKEVKGGETAYLPELQIGPKLEGVYVDPPLGSSDEIDSFNFQAATVNRTEAPPKLQQAIARVEQRYQKSRWTLRKDFISHEHIWEVCDRVRRELGDKTPGAIFIRQGLATNKDVFDKVGIDAIVQMVKDRILKLLDKSVDHRYVADAIRIFIKREAHKASKAAQRRWRLIWGVSLIDQIIDRLLYEPVCETEIANYEEIPAKPGLGFTHGTTETLVHKYSNGSRKWRSFDAKSFDISAPGWGLAAVREINERLCSNPFGQAWENWKDLSRAREQAALYGKFVFSNGVVCKKTRPCIQPSGRYTTISSNCKLVILLRELYDIEKGVPIRPDTIVAMGDDTVQDGIEDADDFVSHLQIRYGVQLTIESEPGEFAEQNFCSKKFVRLPSGVHVPVPLNWDKNMYELSHVESKVCKNAENLRANRAGALRSLCCEYAFHPNFHLLHEKLAQQAPGSFRSADYFKESLTGFE